MVISSARLSVEATRTRKETTIIGPLYRPAIWFEQPEKFNILTESWEQVLVAETGTDGQIAFFFNSDANFCTMKVWFDSAWRDCRPFSSIVNPATGKDWDPLQNL